MTRKQEALAWFRSNYPGGILSELKIDKKAAAYSQAIEALESLDRLEDYIHFLEDALKSRRTYECDPEKNVECLKPNCGWRTPDGVCFRTYRKEYAREQQEDKT